nr:MAG TPA: Serine protease SplB [Bacteriophage sp.]
MQFMLCGKETTYPWNDRKSGASCTAFLLDE